MKLLIRRSQRDPFIGRKPVFGIEVRADISEEEERTIRKYRMGNTILYEKRPLRESPNQYKQLGNALLWRMFNLTIRVDDLQNGKIIESKDILRMLAVHEQLLEAAQTFKLILDAARTFGGEEVMEL